MNIQKIDKLITFGKIQHERDARSAILAVIDGGNGGTSKKPMITKPSYDYGRRLIFLPSEFNLTEIGIMEDVESYVRQAFQKKTALMFKEGEKFAGKNAETIKYIKNRLAQMEHATGILWRNLLRETGYALIATANFFWVKVRRQDASGGQTIGGVAPVAGYFPLGPERVLMKKDKMGNIIKYRQLMPDGRLMDFEPRDIIHFYAYKKTGFGFGTPQIISVKEDIRALRRIEENIELLVYQTLFPIFQYKVGTEAKPATDIRMADGSVISEVDYVKNQIREMPAEGGIVTPERHEIKFIGAEGKALKAKEYLDYFKTRVLSGLGVSSVDMGEGSTANRATADSMSNSMVDSVKDFQDILETFIDKHVIKELLLESTFAFDVLAPENVVNFKFLEIDLEEQMKKNTNAQVMYGGNILDIDEVREILGEEPITPEQEEKMFLNRVKLKEIEAQTQGAAQIAEIRADAILGKAAAAESSTSKSAKNSNAPTNQHGTKTGPQASRLDYLDIRDGYIGENSRALSKDIVNHIKREIISKDWIKVLVDMNRTDMVDKYLDIDKRAFAKGYKEITGATTVEVSDKIIGPLNTRTKHYINKLLTDMQGKVTHIVERGTKSGEKRTVIAKQVEDALGSILYRGDFIDSTERAKAYNYGRAVALRDQGFELAKLEINTDCDICKEYPKVIDLADIQLDKIPPFHPNSSGFVSHGV